VHSLVFGSRGHYAATDIVAATTCRVSTTERDDETTSIATRKDGLDNCTYLEYSVCRYLDWQQATEALLPVQGLITLTLTLTQAS
jgi:hypothetical protein